MKRVVYTILVAALLSAPVGAVAAGPELSRGGTAKFPHRSFLLSLPPGTIAEPSDVAILENGDRVHDLSVTPAGSAASGELGTVLVIDASNSMKGAPIRRAMVAARSFATHRQEAQQLGVVTFNRSARLLLSPTTDPDRITAALAQTPPLAKGTRIRDAAMLGLRTLEGADIRVGSLVVLSDGDDTGSSASTKRLVAAAEARGVRIFTVGLESRFFDPQLLESLARATGAQSITASAASDLDRIFDELGTRLSQEYLVEYSSVAGRGTRIKVDAVVDGFPSTATLTYRSAKLNAATGVTPPPKANGIWSSAAVMVAVGFGAAFLICFGIAWIAIARRRPESAEERVAAFVAMGEPETQSTDEPTTDHDRFYDRIESRLQASERWRRFALNVEIAQVNQAPAKIALVTAVVTVLVMWLFTAISGATWVAIFALTVPFGVTKLINHRANKQRTLFSEQLADNLQVLASAMRAGQSFAGALAVAVEDAPEPAKREFERVVADEQLGVPLETALGTVVERMDNRDLHQVALVAALQREAGGNSAEVLDRVADTIRDRVALRRLISTLTAQGRLSRWVVTLMPVGVAMFISLSNPGYLDPLLHTSAGKVMLIIALIMGFTGSVIIKKIIEIKV